MTRIESKQLTETKAVQQYKRDIQALILANLTREEISECLGIDLNTTTRVTNKVLEAVKKEEIDIFKATSAPTRKLLLFSSVHDVLAGLLLSEVFKTKRAIQGYAMPPEPTSDIEASGIRTKRSTAHKASKPATEAMLYNRLGLLVDLIRKNDKAYFDTVGAMGVAAPRAPIQTKGPLGLPTNNNFENMSELQALEELKSSAKRQSAYADRRIRELSNRVELDADCEVIDD